MSFISIPVLAKCLLYSFTIVSGLIAALYLWIRPKSVDPSLPGPMKSPLIGVTFGTEAEIFEKGSFSWSKWPTLSLLLSRQYNFRTWGGPTLNIGFGGAFFNIVSPDELRHVLRDNFDNYIKGKVARKCLQEILGTGIFTADGDVWKLHRKIVSTLMSKEMVKHGATLMRAKLQQVEMVLEQAADTEQELDWQDLCFRITLDVFTLMAFGVELDCVQNQAKHTPFMEAFNEIQSLCHQRFNDLLWEIKQYFCLTERERRIRDCAKVIDEFAEEIITAAHHKVAEDRPDILSRFLQHAKANQEKPPTNKELRDIVMNFILAGRESTACALSWTMFELTKRPHIADKIREEVASVCGKGDNACYTYETMEQLEYTHAVVMEALRLHSPVPDDFKFAINDDVLPDGTHIPSGSCVMYSPYTINHSDKVWGDNVDEFCPERFLNAVEPSPFRFPTFNAGPRLCPGKPLALMEIKMALSFLLPRFDFVDASCHSGEYRWTLVMAMEGGFPVRVRRRSG